MKRKPVLISLTLIIALSVMTGAAFAQPFKMGRGQNHWQMMDERIVSNLDLSPKQVQEIDSLKTSLEKETAPLRITRNRLRTELDLLWMQEKPELDKITDKEKALHELAWQLKEKLIAFRVSFRKVLTPEQLTQFLATHCGGPCGLPKKGLAGPYGTMGENKPRSFR